ncbi:MAG: hypothetical protein GOVbin2066_52 [Prokaryotic dsDNA virus sp.]|nr:MAG: hypothetical protein GOVbin2066_52 [Prokaryotic dsDNA virus sp.]|tara:strand:- start:7187 stop:7585 length:399 start_codon:yes stop_codon:yes gene_type:complete
MAKLGAKAGWNENYVQSVTASTTLNAGDSGKVFTVATDTLVITLPACEAGLKFTFVNTGADGNNIITLSPQETDGIWGTITLAGSVVDLGGVANKDLINTKGTAIKGDSVTLVSDGTDWYVTASTGIWAAEA